MVKNKDFTMAFKKIWGMHVPIVPIPPDAYAYGMRRMIDI